MANITKINPIMREVATLEFLKQYSAIRDEFIGKDGNREATTYWWIWQRNRLLCAAVAYARRNEVASRIKIQDKYRVFMELMWRKPINQIVGLSFLA